MVAPAQPLRLRAAGKQQEGGGCDAALFVPSSGGTPSLDSTVPFAGCHFLLLACCMQEEKGPSAGGAEVDVRTNHEGFAALRPGGMERDLPAGGSGGAGLSVGSLRRIACRRGAQNRSGHRPAEPISSIGTGSPRGRARLDRTLQEAIRTKTNLDISYRGSSRIRWVAHAGETAG